MNNVGFSCNLTVQLGMVFWSKSTLLTSNYKVQLASHSVVEEGQFWLSMC